MREIIFSALIVFLVSLSSHACAANYSNPIDGIFKGIYGNTISVEVPSLVSKSPVADQDQNGDLSFQFNPNTSYMNFNQLTDLKYGDPVRVAYNEDPTGKAKQMIASAITRLEPVIVANPNAANADANANVDAASAPAVTQTVVTTTTTKVNSQ